MTARTIVVSTLLFVLVFWLLLPPAPGSTDTHAFKDAGSNLALGRGMVTLLNFGNPTIEPKLYAGYAPGLQPIYGGYASLVGVGPEENTLFELTVAAAATSIAFCLLCLSVSFATRGERILLFLCFAAALVTRYVSIVPDRPDALGLAIALAAQIPPLRSRRAALASALLAGMAMLVSPIAGFLAVVGIAMRWLLRVDHERPSLATMVWIGLLGSCGPTVLASLLMLSLDPSYLHRLLGFGEIGLVGVGLLQSGDFASWWELFYHWGYPTLHHWMHSALLAVVTVGALSLVHLSRVHLDRGRRTAAVALILAMGLTSLAIVPWNKLYGSLTAGFLLPTLVVALPSQLWRSRTPRRVLLGILLVLVGLQGPLTLQRLWSQASIGASYDRMQAFLRATPLPDRTGDGEVWVFADPYAFFLFKPLPVTLVSLATPWSDGRVEREKADYFIFSYPGSGDPLTPHRPAWWPEFSGETELVYRPTLPQVLTLFGYRLSNSSQTWEVEIWGRDPS